MVKINCGTKELVKLTELVPFQGELKKRTDADIAALAESIEKEGLMMPFAIWKHEGQKYLLDGHGRLTALIKLATKDTEILTSDWPCVYVEAETEDDARKALLQITSQYGKITRQGVKQFCVSIPDYRAPAIQKFMPKVAKAGTQKVAAPKSDKAVLRICVAADKLAQVKEILGQFDFIEVL